MMKDLTLLIDLSNMLYAMYYNSRNDISLRTEAEKNNKWRESLISIILKYKSQFKPTETILVVDSKSWRYDILKYYKCRRTLRKNKDNVDWDEFKVISNGFIEEFKYNLPVKVLKVNRCEADDLIGILSCKMRDRRIQIISRDKDFAQLLKYKNINILDPITNKEITCDNPHEFLTLHFLKGDDGDDVPNILSPDNIHVTTGRRQKCITKGIIEEVLQEGLDKYVQKNNLQDNFNRNRYLIELSEEVIPQDLQTNIIYEYNKAKVSADYEDMMCYLAQHDLDHILTQ